MADTVVKFLLEKLLQLLSEDVQLIAGVEDEFKDLLEQVRILSGFIDDVAKLVWESNMWKEMDKAIRITVYRTEDIVDKFLVEARLYQERNKLKKMFSHDHASRVRDLSTKIKAMIEEMKQIPRGDRQALPPAENLQLEIETEEGPQESKDLSLEDDEVVGFDEEAKMLIHRLIEGPKDLEVIPIVGMPGLGKTALAKKVNTDPQICCEFVNNIWIYVGQLNKIKDIFLKILKQFTRNIEEHQENKDANELGKLICNFLAEGGRCLIVLDDVWEPNVVDSVMKVFPENNKGHRIMITTRLGYVASYANEDPHNLKFLSQKDSFKLLKMKIFGKRKYPDELIGLGESIAEKCNGLPLAIVVIAGALIFSTNKSDWIRVEKNVMGYLINKDDPSSCLNYVRMSYDSLSQEMQSCFLYFGAFPRGFDIPAWKLIRLWIAEGLIKSNPAFTFEETAQYYLNGLVSRNLVMVMSSKTDGQIKTCCAQNLLHEFCKIEASRKWFFQEISSADPDQAIVSIHDPSTSRRLCIQSSALHYFLSTTPFAEHVRSFYCFSTRQIELPPSNIKSICKAFPLIRVLDIESLNFFFSKEFFQLFHLRYIAISGDFMALPTAFGKFWNIQTLILSTSAPILEIKAEIWNMLRLRHIHTNVPVKLPSPPTSAGKPSVLQTLSHVAPESLRKDVLAKVCYLKKLSIRGPMMAFLETNKGGWHNLEELRWLENLKLVNDVISTSKSLPLPPFFKFLRTLTKLTLSNTRFDWTEAVRLGQLECLEVLKLKEYAFIGDSWRPEIGGFGQLQILWIGKAELRTWEASKLHFPRLRHLVLISCENLEAVPYELADVPSFQEMRLENTHGALRSAREIERKKQLESIKFKLTIFPPDADY